MSGLGGDGIELSNVFIVSQCVTFILIFTEIRIAGNKVSCFVLFTETHSQFGRFTLQPRSALQCTALVGQQADRTQQAPGTAPGRGGAAAGSRWS